MSNFRMAGNGILQKANDINQQLLLQQEKIKAVMDRQTRRDIAAAQGTIIPFSSADILKL